MSIRRILSCLGWEANGDRWTRSGLAPDAAWGSSYSLDHACIDESEALRSAADEVEQIVAWSNAYWRARHSGGREPDPEIVVQAGMVLSRRVESLETQLAASKTDEEKRLARELEAMRLAWMKARTNEGQLRKIVERRDSRIAELESMLAMKCPHGTAGPAANCRDCVSDWMKVLGAVHARMARPEAEDIPAK